jgi:hypothetical protein
MHLAKVVTVVAALVSLTIAPAHAAPKGAKAPKVAKAVSAPKGPGVKAPKTTAAPKGPKAAKTTTVATKSTGKSARSTAPKKSTLTASTTPSSPSTTTTTTTDFTEGKVGELLTKNSAIRSKLESQLKALGYEGTVYEAAYGFKNLGQLQATVNNVQNHEGMTFEQLKVLMTGTWVDADGVVLKANLNPDGTVTMVPPDEVTNPAPTQSLGQAKKTITTELADPEPTQTASN